VDAEDAAYMIGCLKGPNRLPGDECWR
jgi:hypothetical protein